MRKPKLLIDITGPDGNIFFILAKVKMLLEKHKRAEVFIDLKNRVEKSGNYYRALYLISELIDFIDLSEDQQLYKIIEEGKNK